MSKAHGNPVTNVASEGGATVVTLSGELDMHRAPELRERLTEIVARRPRQLVLDFGDVRFLDSTGLGTLVYFLREVAMSGGKMALVNLSAAVQNVLEITRLSSVFSIFPTTADAIRAFDGPQAGPHRP